MEDEYLEIDFLESIHNYIPPRKSFMFPVSIQAMWLQTKLQTNDSSWRLRTDSE